MLIPALLRFDWPIVVFGAALLGLGYLAGWLITRTVSQRRVARDSEQALARLREVATRVAEGVGRHATRVLELSSEVDATRGAGVPSLNEIIRESLADVVLANEHLQEQLKGANVKLERQAAEIEAQVAANRTDVLTGLGNRRGFEDELNRRYAEWLRHERVFSLMMIDLAVFKDYLECPRETVSDEILRAVGRSLPCTFREMDVAIRYGAQEFAIILPCTNLQDALAAAERVRPMLLEPLIKLSRKSVQVSISIGVAQVLYEVGVSNFVARAEDAVAAAKLAGGNCTFFHDGETCCPAEQASDVIDDDLPAAADIRTSDAAQG